MFIEACLTILDTADKATRLYDWFTGAKFGGAADKALDTRRRDDPDLIKVSEHVFVDRRIRELVTASGSAELIDPRTMRELIDPVASAVRGTVLTSQIIETPERLRTVLRRNPWDLLDDIRPVHHALPDNRTDWVPVAFWEAGVEYIGYQKRGAMEAFGFDFTPVSSGSPRQPARVPVTGAGNAGQIVPPWGASAGVRQSPRATPDPGATPDQLRAVLTRVFGLFFGARGVVFEAQLDAQRIAALGRHFRPKAGEQVLGYFDSSLFGNASVALVFTTQTISVVDRSWTKLNQEGSITYRDLLSCPISMSFPGKVRFGDRMSYIPNANNVPAAELEKAIARLQHLMHPYFS